MERQWKRFRPDYEVSNYGEVKSLERTLRNGKHRKEKILKPQFVGDYLGVYLPDPETGKQKWAYVHRLVAEAFIPNPDNLPQVNHKDCLPTNNKVDNLEWCDERYNVRYSLYKNGILPEDFSGMTEDEIKELRREKRLAKSRARYKHKMQHTVYAYEKVITTKYVPIGEYKNVKEASKDLNIGAQAIYKRVNNKDLTPIARKARKIIFSKEKLE